MRHTNPPRTINQAKRELYTFESIYEQAQAKGDTRRMGELLPLIQRLATLTNQPCAACEA